MSKKASWKWRADMKIDMRKSKPSGICHVCGEPLPMDETIHNCNIPKTREFVPRRKNHSQNERPEK